MGLQPNKTLRALREAKWVVGGECFTGWPPTALMYAALDLDFIWIDMEHTCLDLGPVANVVQIARLAGITPLVRVNKPEYHLINRLLDNGAQGVIVPYVEDPEVARRVVSYCQFPPEGVRGCGIPFLANDCRDISVGEYVAGAAEELLVAIMIESRRGVEAIDEIAAVPGLDVVIVGRHDLSISLGWPGQVDHPDALAALDRVISACLSRGVAVGIPGPSNLDHWAKKGVRFFTPVSDVGILHEACRKRVEEVRQVLAPLGH